MVFRRDSKVDAFQRQISALRHQLGGEGDEAPAPERSRLSTRDDAYRHALAELDAFVSETGGATREMARQPEPDYPTQLLPAVPALDEQTSVIAHTTTWSGNLESTGSLHLHGRVEGSITARDDVFIAEEAEVDAVVHATNVTIAGNMRGTVNCTARLEILPRGRVAGDINAPVLVVHEGAVLAGDVAMAAPADRKSSQAASPRERATRGSDRASS